MSAAQRKAQALADAVAREATVTVRLADPPRRGPQAMTGTLHVLDSAEGLFRLIETAGWRSYRFYADEIAEVIFE
ncbi:hypothetical protein [Arthrobacter phage SWEP2]|uniref:Uncharacterized protein n=1 Tax=Arthrobacter phage SWEP2 TaxID=2945958 RepID=A0A9E7MIW8_9CAUD|nr:hypothetical protein [Arthrobacter phage SWEP2]